jgi:hypothetical protein
VQLFIKHRINQIFVLPSCRLQLKAHMLISHFPICLDTVIKHYKWDLDQVAFSAEEQAHSSKWLNMLGNEKVGKLTLTSICQSIAVKRWSSFWQSIFSSLLFSSPSSSGMPLSPDIS